MDIERKKIEITPSQEEGVIDNIVAWYSRTPSDFVDINTLINKRAKMSGFLVTYANEVGLQKRVWNATKCVTEKKKMGLRSELILKGDPITKAEVLSRSNTIRQFEKENEEEAEFFRMYYKLKAYNEVLSSMSQQIAYLREELINIKKV